jgi:hypothetical protein
MTQEQEQHLELIKNETLIRLDKKYRVGQEVHGGNLFDLSPRQLIDEAINEAIDQLTYLLTLQDAIYKGNPSSPNAVETSGTIGFDSVHTT